LSAHASWHGSARSSRSIVSKSNASFQHASCRGTRPRSSRDAQRSGRDVMRYLLEAQLGYRSVLWSSVTPNLFRAPSSAPARSISGDGVVCTIARSGIVYAATSDGIGCRNVARRCRAANALALSSPPTNEHKSSSGASGPRPSPPLVRRLFRVPRAGPSAVLRLRVFIALVLPALRREWGAVCPRLKFTRLSSRFFEELFARPY